jgi:hypothetical protein
MTSIYCSHRYEKIVGAQQGFCVIGTERPRYSLRKDRYDKVRTEPARPSSVQTQTKQYGVKVLRNELLVPVKNIRYYAYAVYQVSEV